MDRIVPLDITSWLAAVTACLSELAIQTLEAGGVAFLPGLAFSLQPEELALLGYAALSKAKNISFDLATGKVRGTNDEAGNLAPLNAMLSRYATQSRTLISNLLPDYASSLLVGRTSFRPTEIRGRVTSWRKDDTRLHVDSFPSSPVAGRRILRVFTNINPDGQTRTWRVGETFPQVAGRYVPHVPKPLPGSSWLMQRLHITKSRRTPYDHYMLKLHDSMKADAEYQRSADQITYEFPAGSTWMCFTDQVSHAAMGGQHLLEQTFYLPVAAMRAPERSPLRVIESLTGRSAL